MGQAISSTQFFLYGKKHFTQTGYLKHIQSYYDSPVQRKAFPCTAAATAAKDGKTDTTGSINDGKEQKNDNHSLFVDDDGVDLSGKSIVVTGANSGLGFQVTCYAASKKAAVYMLCRSAERAEKARQQILDQIPDASLEIVQVDVSELDQVRAAAKQLAAKQDKIHALVCNAGVLLNERKVSSTGVECTFASHLLGGSYLLSQLLLPQLEAAASDSRVIMVTSGGMYNYKLPNWETLTNTDPDKYNGVNAYAYAKRGQVLLTEQMAQQNPNIKWVTVHPGWADTAAVDDAFGDQKKYLEPLREPWQGAEGVAWLTGCDASKLESGALYLDRKVQPKHLAGPFFSEGSYTKNNEAEVQEFMKKLKEAAGL